MMTEAISVRSRNLVLVLALLLVGVTACAAGSSRTIGTGTRPSGTTPDALEGSLSTLAATGDRRGGSAVRSWSVDDVPRTVVTNLATGKVTELARGSALYAVTIWQTDDAIGVLGATCPKWDSGAAPRWDDDSQRNVPERCGRTTYRVWQVDRSSGVAHRLDVSGLTATNGYVATSVRGNTVLLVGRGDDAGLVALDLSTGALRAMAPLPGTGGSAEAVVQACLGPDGRAFGVLAWSGDAPPAVHAGSWESDAVDGGTSLVVLVPDATGSWSPVPASGTVDSFEGVPGCGPDGMWRMGPRGGGQVDVRDGRARLTPIPAPATTSDAANEVNVLTLSGGGGPLVASQAVPTGVEPDAPRAAASQRWADGAWHAVPSVALGASSLPFLDGDRVGAVQRQAGEGRFRVVLP
jgi:hypothetical protein